jgi:uncharacterized protein (DUF2126 family)
MPPNARMSLAQQLLVRALIARFWKNPARRQVRALGHDAPRPLHAAAFVWADFLDVLDDLRQNGFDVSPEWFEAQLEFRFPFCGEVEYEGSKLELRQALEPWHVMGEEGADRRHRALCRFLRRTAAGRLETSNPERYTVVCNGRTVPLKVTGTAGVSVAGVRFKAWQPASGCIRSCRSTRR